MDPRIQISGDVVQLTLTKEEMFALILDAASNAEEHGDPKRAEELHKLLEDWEP